MKTLLFPGLGLVLSAAVSACSSEAPSRVHIDVVRSDLARETSPLVPDEDAMTLASDNASFAFDLFARLPGKQNVAFSPHSISIAFAMTYAGARGQTEEEMAATLHYTLPQEQLHPAFNEVDLALLKRLSKDDEQKLSIVNAFWGQKDFDFESEFLDRLAVNYDAGVQVLDFIGEPERSRSTINRWVSEQTEKKIPELLPKASIQSKTRAVLTNAVYMKARWNLRFDEARTSEDDFELDEDSSVSVDTMHQLADFDYYAAEDFEAVRLPYKDRNLSMWILLPSDVGLTDLEAQLTPSLLDEVDSGFTSTTVDLSLPKFLVRTDFALKEMLTDMGMPTPFLKEADFSGISGTPLYIANAFHDAYVQIDEVGTEAAAATGVVLNGDASAPFFEDPVAFTVDHPFLFLIRDQPTGAILFMGRVVDPR